MTISLVSWLDQQHNLLRDEISTRVLAPAGTVFRTAGESATQQIIERMLAALRDHIAGGDRAQVRITVVDAVASLLNTRLSFQDLRIIALALRQTLLDQLDTAQAPAPASHRSIEDWLYQFALQIGLYSIVQREELIEEQASELEVRLAELQSLNGEQSRLLELLRQVSTPVAPIHEGIIAVPLVGALDTYRAQSLTEQLLEAIMQQQAEMVILDISGVPLFDTSIAQRLVQTARAARMLGAQIILVGMSPEVAQTVIQLGIELSDLVTRRSLQDGLAYALARRHYRIVPAGKG